jgi:rfaE bifunctional protein nucleotidyltransferase chain/domain
MFSQKHLAVEELAAVSSNFRASGRRLVFTNGVFDLLHVGHVRYLAAARALGEALLVAVNGDGSVRALKGPTRPIHGELDRAEVLAALACVDFVTIFHTERVTDLVRAIRPQIYAKGGDYTIASLDPGERAALEEVGAEIRILPLVPGKSTTAALRKIEQGAQP